MSHSKKKRARGSKYSRLHAEIDALSERRTRLTEEVASVLFEATKRRLEMEIADITWRIRKLMADVRKTGTHVRIKQHEQVFLFKGKEI